MTGGPGSLKGFLLRQSLQTKLIASYLVVLIIPVSLFTAYAATSSRDFVRENADQALRGMAEKASDAFRLKIEQYEQAISLCVYRQELQNVYANRYESYYDLYVGLTEKAIPFLSAVASAHSGEVRRILVYCENRRGPYGPYLMSSDEVKHEPWYVRAMSAGGIHWSIGSDELLATCRIDPISGLSGSAPLGVFCFSLRLSDFIDRYVGIEWDTYRLSILDDSGRMLYDEPRGNESLLSDGEDRLEYSFLWDRQGWSFRYSVPLRSILGPASGFFALPAAIIVAGTLLFVALIVLFSRMMLRRLWALRDTMLVVESGNLDIDIGRGAGDEIGILTDTFADMVANLRASMREVEEAQRQKGEAEIRLLRAQIDPHFLYNSLSYINWKALRAGQDDISFLTGQLAVFYRTCLNRGQELTTVGEEMRNIRAFADIQLATHDRSFDVEYRVQDGALELPMLNFLLQPLVENAILHGADKVAQGRGLVVVSCALRGDELAFGIEDNGPGLPDSEIQSVLGRAKPGSGYGVYNVLSRIRLYYGPSYGISLANRPGGGLAATLAIPARPRLP